MFISGINNCPHFFKNKFIDYNSLQYFSFNDVFDNIEDEYSDMKLVNLLFNKKENEKEKEEKMDKKEDFIFEKIFKKEILNYNNEIKSKEGNIYFLCLSCGKILHREEEIDFHLKEEIHYIALNLTDISVWCLECKNPYFNKGKKGTPLILNENQISLIKNHLQYLREKKYLIPFYKFYSKEEIYNIKYNKFIQNFKEKKYKNIIFMVGAGISTTAGIPDFRSKTGLFQQLQEKYGMSSPEEFFYKKTFLEKPEFFYEFCKIFDLSQVKPTLTHKFMKYMIDKGIVKYVFTQNIDGLELKAKIPKEKIVFAHGTFTEGHCSKCNVKVDINKINEGINNGTIIYCDICGGPCKPNVVFYGEDLSDDFYKKAGESKDCDLVIIMGTSLQVYPFAKIPKLLKIESWKVVFNRDKVGTFLYNFLFSNTLFVQGTTDNTVLKFLKDIDLLDDFKKYLGSTFGDDNLEISDNVKMIDIKNLSNDNNEIKNDSINNNQIKEDIVEDKKTEDK
jgi:NAD-dependent SIR2 family protein deacetylase